MLACSGFRHVSVNENLCECVGRGPGATSDEPLCARQWDNAATPPAQNWGCNTTPSGTASDGHAYVASVPMPPQHPGFGITAFIGGEGMPCMGYYRPRTASGGQAQIGGHMTGCGMQNIDTKWEPVSGQTAGCATLSDDDRVRCRLTPAEWQQLQQRRMDCGFPPRSRTGERAAGPSDDQGQMLITTAIFQGRPVGGITAFSSRAQRDLEARRAAGSPTVGPMCPMEMPIANDWSSRVGGTRYHAEGGTLLRYAEAVGRDPTTPEFPSAGGVATLLVDRRACNLFCRPGGIDQARRAAGIENLQVRSPGGCLLFNAAAPRGTPCPPNL
jgi:hypothetical protein